MPLPAPRHIAALLSTTIAFAAASLHGAQHGTIETSAGARLVGEIEFSKELVTVKELSGEIHHIPTADLRRAEISDSPDKTPQNPQPARHGLRGHYFSNIRLIDTAVERIDAVISFDWGETAPAKQISPNGFSVRWEGEVEAPVSGEITFEVESDDGCRLWIDGKKLIDHWQAQPATTHSGTIQLEANKRYPIKLEYYDGWSLAVARLRWKAAGLGYDIVPADRLYPLPLVGPASPEQLHEVRLKSGSSLAGLITHADTKRIRIVTADGEISIPTPAVAHLRFARAWGSDLAHQLDTRPPGCALLNRDYAEGSFKGFANGVLKLESVLFGQQTIQQAEIRAIKFAEQSRRAPKFRLLTRSDTAILADEITSLPGGQLKIRDSSRYHITVPAAHIRQIRAAATGTPGPS